MSAMTIGGTVCDAADAAPASTRAAANDSNDVAAASQPAHGANSSVLRISAVRASAASP
jgi:hypothetical protein